MVKSKTLYVCQECGHSTFKWMGKCPDCASWNTLIEEIVGETLQHSLPDQRPISLAALDGTDEYRFSSGMAELDRVLGGGIIPGSIVLLGGDPGVGKSTLLLQVAGYLAQQGRRTLYLSGEESPRQIKMRSERMNLCSENILLLTETNISSLGNLVDEIRPDLVIIDSIQTVSIPELSSAPGSVAQLRECTFRLMELAKKTECPFFVIGHVTKEGVLAGPKILEHIVDTVIYFEGDQNNYYRLLRAIKNRFGSVNELGIMEMTGSGLIEVDNPSRIFLSDHRSPGSIVVACFEGTRVILVEIEALVVPSTVGYPRRMTTGLDTNRLALIAAVLEKRVGFTLSNKDIYLKVAGGATIKDPATDLGVAMAVASSYREYTPHPGLLVIGELGLSGEVKPVPYLDLRLKEAEKLGFFRALVPRDKSGVSPPGRIEVSQVLNLDNALEAL